MNTEKDTTVNIPFNILDDPTPFYLPKPFIHPISICISGTTGSGKTTWIYKFLKNINHMFENEIPEKVLYCYGIYQDLYDKIKKDINFVTFHEGLPNKDTLFNLPASSMVIIDDLCHKLVNDTDIELLFSQISHHRKISICFMKNNLFYQGKNARTITLNTNTLVLMKNPTDTYQIQVLARRILGKNASCLIDAYDFAVNKTNRGYLVIDLSPSPTTNSIIKTGIFPNELLILFNTVK